VSARVQGKIVAVRDNGNLVTDIDESRLVDAPRDERVLIRCDEHETTCIFGTVHNQPPATLIAVLGESGCLELEVVGDSARIMLGVGLGEGVEVSW
jgi:S-adenosylmethionine hydrolase